MGRAIAIVQDDTWERREPEPVLPVRTACERSAPAEGGALLAVGTGAMRIHDVATAIVSLLYALFNASCLQSPTATPEPAPGEAQSSNGPEPIEEAQEEAGGAPYQSKDFRFVVFVKDDGKGKGGGWQTADKTFHFMERNWGIPRYFWQCPIRIGMPIRSDLEGPITPGRAALYSAEAANAVVDPLLDSRATWENQGAAFCVELRDRLQEEFHNRYPHIGATVSRP